MLQDKIDSHCIHEGHNNHGNKGYKKEKKRYGGNLIFISIRRMSKHTLNPAISTVKVTSYPYPFHIFNTIPCSISNKTIRLSESATTPYFPCVQIDRPSRDESIISCLLLALRVEGIGVVLSFSA